MCPSWVSTHWHILRRNPISRETRRAQPAPRYCAWAKTETDVPLPGGRWYITRKTQEKEEKDQVYGIQSVSTVLSTSTVPVMSTSLQSRGNSATTPGESSFLTKTTDRSRAERRYQHRLARRSRQRRTRRAARVLASRTEEAKSTGDPARSPDRVSHRRSKEARVARRRRQRRRQLYEQIRQKTVAKLLQFVNLQGGTDYDEATPKIPADWQPTTCRDMGSKQGTTDRLYQEHLPVTCTAVQSYNCSRFTKTGVRRRASFIRAHSDLRQGGEGFTRFRGFEELHQP